MLVTLRTPGLYILQLLTSQYTFLDTFAYILRLLFILFFALLENKQITSPSTSHKSNCIILFREKFDEEQDRVSKYLHNFFFINDKGTNNNLTMEKPQGHHLSQDTSEIPVGMHWGHNGTLAKNAWPETIMRKTGQTQIGDHSIHQPVHSLHKLPITWRTKKLKNCFQI